MNLEGARGCERVVLRGFKLVGRGGAGKAFAEVRSTVRCAFQSVWWRSRKWRRASLAQVGRLPQSSGANMRDLGPGRQARSHWLAGAGKTSSQQASEGMCASDLPLPGLRGDSRGISQKNSYLGKECMVFYKNLRILPYDPPLGA